MSMDSFFHESVHVYVDEKSLKIAQVRVLSGKKHVTGVFYKNIENLSSDALSQTIRTGILSLKSTARHVTVVLPSKYAITKNIEVPSLDEEEIGNIIRLQAVRHTPYSKEEVIVGHINLERILDRYTKVLLVIVSNENIRKKTDIFELAGYEIEGVHLSADVLVRLISQERPAGTDSPYGLISVETDSSDFIIIHNGKPQYIRSIPAGLTQLNKDASAAVAQLVEEFKKTCEAYQTEDQGQPVKRFLVAGAASSPAQDLLLKGLREEFKLEAEAFNPDRSLPLGPEARHALGLWGPVPFLDVFADGLCGSAAVDLLPEDLKIRRSFREKGKEMFKAAIFIIVILGLMVSVFLAKIYFRNHYLNEITRNFDEKQKEADELDAVSEETRFVKEFRTQRGVAGKVLDEFQNVLPQDMYLGEISLTDDGHVSIKGTSKLMSTVFSFVTQLENSPRFKNVTSDYTKSRKENDKEVSDFGLSALLKEARVPKPEAAPAPAPAKEKT